MAYMLELLAPHRHVIALSENACCCFSAARQRAYFRKVRLGCPAVDIVPLGPYRLSQVEPEFDIDGQHSTPVAP